MLEDARALVEAGVDGLVFGVLLPDGSVDVPRCRQLMELAGGRETVFHRAFDVVPDWRLAMDQLVELGVTRILTSGQAPSVPLGVEPLRQMVEYARGRIQILPGGGIRPANIRQVVAQIGCTQVHAAAGGRRIDTSCQGNGDIHFGGALYPPEDLYTVTDPQKVQALLSGLERR